MAFDTIYNKNGTIRGYAQTDNYERLGVHNLLHVQDRKAAGTHGGTFTAGAYRTREFNTVLTNNITGASLENNQITLPGGIFYVEASAPALFVYNHIARLWDVSSSVELLLGTTECSQNATALVATRSFVSGKISIESTSVLELQHICAVTRADSGFGRFGDLSTEIYSDLKIWKVA